MPGPLPASVRRRRNAPTIPTTELPAAGRPGPIPKPPKWTPLGTNGAAFWRWVWHTPMAAGWSDGHLATVARRAALEDDLAALATVESLDANDVIGELDPIVRALIQQLASLATGRLAVVREMRELDKVLGLTPKGMADLRWTIVAGVEAVPEANTEADEITTRREGRRARLNAS